MTVIYIYYAVNAPIHAKHKISIGKNIVGKE